MKVAIVGYGKMGQTIEKILLERKHEIVIKTNELQSENLEVEIDVAIEFSQPDVAYQNLQTLLKKGIPTVCGTTGWLHKKSEIEALALENNTAFLYASNFSLGVNLFFALNERLAQLMQSFTEYEVDIEEVHHTEKKDAPSGTAITLAEQIIAIQNVKGWTLIPEKEAHKIAITALREPEVPGTHTISYRSEIDDIYITHQAHSRKGFALGAVMAAEYISNKHGVFQMQDVLGIRE